MRDRAAAVSALADWMAAAGRLVVISGAGISTASGIPGYRDAAGNWQRRQPVTHQEFLGSEAVRRRYWARSMLGWPMMHGARPNPAHLALARLETEGRLASLITQNVDGLHGRAGSASVIELHGRLADVVCMECGARHPRAQMQTMLEAANVALAGAGAAVAPDGDADLEADFSAFEVPGCPACGGLIKPDVVFYGDSVPRPRATAASAAIANADAVLVVGSSLMVRSGFRLCEAAHAAGTPLAAINVGHTRADPLLGLKVEMDCVAVLPELVDALAAQRVR
jgi:NAD-dependent SIR2 family protein deacetylase